LKIPKNILNDSEERENERKNIDALNFKINLRIMHIKKLNRQAKD
jgi:hypothetical protein